jgi:hypothetical protein
LIGKTFPANNCWHVWPRCPILHIFWLKQRKRPF